jgi:plastocyanin
MVTMPTLTMLVLAALLASPSPAAKPPSSPSTQPIGPSVHIKDDKYVPPMLRVHTGDRVTFVNDDDEAHTVTAKDRSFDSAGIDTHESWQHVFSKAGKFSYFCALHPYMKAVIIVTDRTPGSNNHP